MTLLALSVKSIVIQRNSVLSNFGEEIYITQKTVPKGSWIDAASAISKKVLFYIGFLYLVFFGKRFTLPEK